MFNTYGLWTQGTAYAALGEPPYGAIISIGGLDAHSGAVTKRVRRYNIGNELFSDAPPLTEFARRDHTATRLAEPDDQFYLIAGGKSGDDQVLGALTLYNALQGPLTRIACFSLTCLATITLRPCLTTAKSCFAAVLIVGVPRSTHAKSGPSRMT